MFCNKCGSELNPQTNTCPKCSQNQNQADNEMTSAQWTHNSNNYTAENSGQMYGNNYANFPTGNNADYDRTVGTYEHSNNYTNNQTGYTPDDDRTVGGFGAAQGSNYANNIYQQGVNYDSGPVENTSKPGATPYGKDTKGKKVRTKGSGMVPTIIIAIMLVIIILSTGVIAAYKLELIPGINSEDSAKTTSDKIDSSQDESPADENEFSGKDTKETLSGETIIHDDDTLNLERDLNNYISENFSNSSDVAVCVIDNKTNKMYSTEHSEDRYTAWGFYLPIYMALNSEYPGEYDSTRSKIVSTDIATCNTYSNKGIDYLGGFSAINAILAEDYNLFATTYGRKFGDTTAASDNYTTPEDAAMMLKELNDNGDYAILNHNKGLYGIKSPDAATSIYAHIGSENRNVNRNFNVFSITKGNMDCCIAIMTKNQSRAVSVTNDIYAIIFENLQ